MMNQYQAGYVQAQLDSIKDLIRSINATLDRIDLKLDRAAKKIAVLFAAALMSGCSFATGQTGRPHPHDICSTSVVAPAIDLGNAVANGVLVAYALSDNDNYGKQLYEQNNGLAIAHGAVALGFMYSMYEGQRYYERCVQQWRERLDVELPVKLQHHSRSTRDAAINNNEEK